MPDDMVPCDLSVLDELIEAHRQESVLEEFRRRADQHKDRVDEAVYQRVVEDYAARLQTLEDTVEPLRARARAEFSKLRAAYDRLEDAQERARLDKQELEFRGQIGEIETADLSARLEAPINALEESHDGLARLNLQKARFAAAFGSEEALLELTTRRFTPGQPADRRSPVPRGFLTLENEGAEGAIYALGATTRLGRAEDNDICLQNRGISRHHAIVTASVKGFLLRDLGSQNGTVVNGERVAERPLADGDQVAVGDGRLRFTIGPPAADATAVSGRTARRLAD